MGSRFINSKHITGSFAISGDLLHVLTHLSLFLGTKICYMSSPLSVWLGTRNNTPGLASKMNMTTHLQARIELVWLQEIAVLLPAVLIHQESMLPTNAPYSVNNSETHPITVPLSASCPSTRTLISIRTHR